MEEKRTLKRNKMKFSDWTAGSHVIGGQPIGTGPDEIYRERNISLFNCGGSKLEEKKNIVMMNYANEGGNLNIEKNEGGSRWNHFFFLRKNFFFSVEKLSS